MDPLIIPIVAILMPLVLAPTIIFMKHRHKRREWEHRERMRSLEVSGPLPSGHAPVGSGGVAAIGAGVPIASVIAAFLTCVSSEVRTEDEIPMAGIAWGCALMISAGAMATSLILALMQARARRQSESAALQVDKPAVYDPDAFDVVSSRG
jgi:hypothetical protein